MGQGGRHRSGLDIRLVARDEEVTDLVEEPESSDLARLDGWRAGSSGSIHPVGQPADSGHIADHEIPAHADERPADGVPVARLAANVEISGVDHRRSIARAPRVARVRLGS
jgi:hypothetical protein